MILTAQTLSIPPQRKMPRLTDLLLAHSHLFVSNKSEPSAFIRGLGRSQKGLIVDDSVLADGRENPGLGAVLAARALVIGRSGELVASQHSRDYPSTSRHLNRIRSIVDCKLIAARKFA